ncbi:MAG: alkaline phosphatase PafA [Bacteroidota bacterium]|jgi:predicted AlkP superfamily pyrophosphatase or phosphodiesterase
MKNLTKLHNRLAIVILFLLTFCILTPHDINAQISKSPKLVVGIVIDQMRYDYLTRYWDKYGSGGFKKLISEGFICKNTHYNYVPTYTAPGHASIYSGTTPAVHGIISNNWYDKDAGKIVYCVDDQAVNPIGTNTAKGKMSPKRFLATSISDQLRLHNIKKSKTFGIALKDRSAILPAGHSANGAFWFDGSIGGFVSSSHYMDKLPKWVSDFNVKKHASTYLKDGWNTLLPIEKYTESTEDNTKYENAPAQPGKPYFPYDFSGALKEKKYDVIAYTPFGNSITKDLALECIKSEQLGKDEYADLISISFSSTDIIAHAYGIRSIEVEDVYIRLDKDIEELLSFLDKEIGNGNYAVFLTADHGGAENSEFLKDYKIPSGLINEASLQKQIQAFLFSEYKDTLVSSYSNQQIFLNEKVIRDKKLNKNDINEKISSWLLMQPGISEVYSSSEIKNSNSNVGSMKYLLQRGYHQRLSGDILVNYLPAWMEYESKGTTHGAPYSYDTHVPLIFYGAQIKKGESMKRVEITDIAPTVSQLLNVEYPNGCIGNPIEEVFNK